jgi:hypothetical protein
MCCTRTDNLSISGGRLIALWSGVAVATGPLWPCLNVWNKNKPFIVLLNHVLGHEDLTGLKPNLRQVRSREEAMSLLSEKSSS